MTKELSTILKKDFISPTKGCLTFNTLIYDLVDYMEAEPNDKYSVIVGCDSKLYRETTVFVNVILVHRIGKGARYFYQRHYQDVGKELRPRIYQEASMALDLGQQFITRLKKALTKQKLDYSFEIHVDIGKDGPTKNMIREIVGMIEGNGFIARYKPESYCASTVADRHT
jgi:uncharacterized protein